MGGEARKLMMTVRLAAPVCLSVPVAISMPVPVPVSVPAPSQAQQLINDDVRPRNPCGRPEGLVTPGIVTSNQAI